MSEVGVNIEIQPIKVSLPATDYPEFSFSPNFDIVKNPPKTEPDNKTDEDIADFEKVIKEVEKNCLPENHPMRVKIQEISDRLSPGKPFQCFLLVDPEANAFTFEKKKKTYFTTTMISGLSEHLQSKGKPLTVDHLAVIQGHEQSHHDAEAERDHVSEFYCDVAGMEMAARTAGYNPEAVLDVLGYFDFLGNNSSIGVTHPGAGIRRQECAKVLTDSEYFLPGKNKPMAAIEPNLFAGLPLKTEVQERSQTVWFSEDPQEILDMLAQEKDQTMVLEQSRRISDLVQAELGVKIAADPRFHNLLIVIGVLSDDNSQIFPEGYSRHHSTRPEHTDTITNSDLFLADTGTRVTDCITDAQVTEVISTWQQRLIDQLEQYKRNPGKHGFAKEKFEAALPLIEKALAFGFSDPLKILSGKSADYQPFAQLEIDFSDPFYALENAANHASEHNQVSPSGREQPYPIPLPYAPAETGDFSFSPSYFSQFDNQEKTAQKIAEREKLLRVGLPALALAHLRQWQAKITENEKMQKIRQAARLGFARSIFQGAQAEHSTTLESVADFLTQETLFWQGTVSTENLKPNDETQAESLKAVIGAIDFNPIYGDTLVMDGELKQAYRWEMRWFDSDKRISSVLTEIYVESSKTGLIDFCQRVEEGKYLAFPHQSSRTEIEKTLFQKLTEEEEASVVREAIKVIGLDEGSSRALLNNPHLSQEEKTAMVVSLYQEGAIKYWDPNFFLEETLKSSLPEEKKITCVQALLPTLELNYLATPANLESWEFFKKAFPEKSAGERIVMFYKAGGVIDLDNASFLTENDYQALKGLEEGERRKIAKEIWRLTEYQAKTRPDKFSAEAFDRALSTVCYLWYLPLYSPSQTGRESVHLNFPFSISEREKRRFFPQPASFESGLQEILGLPLCSQRDRLILALANDEDKVSSKQDILSFSGFLKPIEPEDTNTSRSTVSNYSTNAVFGGIGYGIDVVAPGKDKLDYFALQKIGYGPRAGIMQKALEMSRQQYQESGASLSTKTADLFQQIPEKCKLRDVYAEQYILDQLSKYVNRDGTFDEEKLISSAEAATILETIDRVLPTLVDASVKTTLGYAGSRLALVLNQRFQGNVQQQLACVEKYLPFFSFRRDELLAEIADSSWTTTEELALLNSKRLANNYRADSPDIIAHRGGAEIARVLAAAMNRQERAQFLLWLFNEKETPKTIEEAMSALSPADIRTLLAGRKDKPFSSIEELKKESPQMYVKAMQKGLPETIRTLLRDNYHIASFREKFMLMNRWERREVLFDFLTGNEGLLQARDQDRFRTEDEGEAVKFLSEFYEIILNPEGKDTQENHLLRDIFVNLMSSLPPERRTNIFCDLVDAMAVNREGKTEAPELTKRFLETFGIIGVKLGQILAEQKDLLPPEYQKSFSELKEDVTPVSKIFTAQILDDEGLISKYPQIGPRLGSASIRQVYLVKNNQGETLVGKFERPNAEETLGEDFQALNAVLAFLKATYPDVAEKIPHGLIPRLRQTIQSELDFASEAVTTNQMAKSLPTIPRGFYRFHPYNFSAASAVESGRRVIFESVVEGQSLDQYFESLPETAAGMAEKVIIQEAIVQNWFYQVFALGKYHADTHRSNIKIKGQNIGFIDWGLCGSINERQQEDFLEFLLALDKGQPEVLATITANYLQDQKQKESVLTKFEELNDPEDPNFLSKVLGLIGQYDVDLQLVTFVKSLIQIKPMMDVVSRNRLRMILAPHFLRLRLIPQLKKIGRS